MPVTTAATCIARSATPTKTCHLHRGRRDAILGQHPWAGRILRSARRSPRRGVAVADRRPGGDETLRYRRPPAAEVRGTTQPVPERHVEYQRECRRRQGRIRRQLFRLAGVVVPCGGRRHRLSAAQRHRRRRQLQLRALRRVPAVAIGGVGRRSRGSRARLDHRLFRERALRSRCT